MSLITTLAGILSSSGASDGGKVPLLNGNGELDDSFFPAALSTVNGVLTFSFLGLLVQMGSSTCAETGTHIASSSVTIPTAYAAKPKVFVQVNSPGSAVGAYLVIGVPSDETVNSFVANFNTNSSDGDNGNITSAITFNWLAIGASS